MATDTPTYWKKVKKGDVVNLTDSQTLQEIMKNQREGSISLGNDVIVTSTDRYEESEGACTWIVVTTDSNLVIIAKIAGDEMDLRVCFVPDDFTPGTKDDLLDNGCQWLFVPPEDENNFIPAELEFADSIINDHEGKEVVFHIKGGTMYGSCGRHFAAITEWVADSDCPNPELIAFETGGLDEDGEQIDVGGYVQFFQGVTVENHDIELMPI